MVRMAGIIVMLLITAFVFIGFMAFFLVAGSDACTGDDERAAADLEQEMAIREYLAEREGRKAGKQKDKEKRKRH